MLRNLVGIFFKTQAGWSLNTQKKSPHQSHQNNKQTPCPNKLSLLLLISVLQPKFYSDLIFWNDWDFWAELLLVCFNSIPNNYIKFSILRPSAKKVSAVNEVLKAFRLHKSVNCFSVSAHSKAGWLKILLPAWTASGNIWHLSTDTYQDAFSVIGSHLTKVVFLSQVQVHEQICIFMFSAVKNCQGRYSFS